MAMLQDPLRLLERLVATPAIENHLLVRTMKTNIIIIAIALMFSSTVMAQTNDEPVAVSIIQLIANPKDFDCKNVSISGFVSLEFEENAIYLSESDYDHWLTKNGLWLDISDAIRNSRAEFDGKYVMVQGRFSMKDLGHMGLWSGSIQNISRFQECVEKNKNKQR